MCAIWRDDGVLSQTPSPRPPFLQAGNEANARCTHAPPFAHRLALHNASGVLRSGVQRSTLHYSSLTHPRPSIVPPSHALAFALESSTNLMASPLSADGTMFFLPFFSPHPGSVKSKAGEVARAILA